MTPATTQDDQADQDARADMVDQAELSVLGDKIRKLQADLAEAKAAARPLLAALRVGLPGGMTKADAARRLGITRPTLDDWLAAVVVATTTAPEG